MSSDANAVKFLRVGEIQGLVAIIGPAEGHLCFPDRLTIHQESEIVGATLVEVEPSANRNDDCVVPAPSIAPDQGNA